MRYSKIFFRFLKLMGQALPLFLFAMIIHMVGDNFLYLTLSYFVNKLIDMAQAGSMEGLRELLIICIAANIAALAAFFVFGALYDIYAKRGNAIVQRMMIEKLLRLPMEYFDKHHTGEIVSKLMNDADTASQIFTSRLRRVTTPLMSVIVYIIPIIIMCPALAACMVFINILSLFVNNRYIPKMKKIAKETSTVKSRLVQSFMDIVNGRDDIRIYSGAGLLTERYQEENHKNAEAAKHYWDSTAKLNTWNTFFDMVLALGFLLIAVLFVERGWCSVGEVAGIYTLYGTFSYNFLELGRYLPELINCIARAQIVFEYMEESEEQAQGDAEFSPGKIEWKEVSFGYHDKEVLHNLSAEFEENKSTAVIGQTGCGKSTLMKLLLRLYPVKDKKIYIGGKDINSINVMSLRKNIAYVPQNTYLFQDTIRENIRFGNLDASNADVEEAAKLANAHEFICGLPDGYDTILQDGGKNLSGGERQRLALARAFIKNAPILLMDEATSALDNHNETEIQAAMKELIRGKTALIVAHRDITIGFCEERIILS
ncbi:MAG: ABC transporter ATP-binding protein/permease [Bacteroidales bacterium]|nr:ABC transporter ATP-binding protein/permease [Lachnoclostridium sp.]MCM1384134.1 ABC transporter ATP-binding protein/permease [Lachnoclostridium sp.]MCM1464800.1 ABC transporter ATP-binding protein/permease [Bacteroidales bacterium]